MACTLRKMIRKQITMPLAVAGIALLATLMAISSPTQALALGHWNLDEDFIPNSGIADDVEDGSGTDEHTDGEEEESTTAAATEEDYDEASEDGSDDSGGKEDSSHAAYEALQACLSDVEEVESPTEQQAQDCMESSYREMDNSEEDSMENTSDDDEDNAETTHDVSTDDTDDEEDEDSEE
jgi:hypothetical protein